MPGDTHSLRCFIFAFLGVSWSQQTSSTTVTPTTGAGLTPLVAPPLGADGYLNLTVCSIHLTKCIVLEAAVKYTNENVECCSIFHSPSIGRRLGGRNTAWRRTGTSCIVLQLWEDAARRSCRTRLIRCSSNKLVCCCTPNSCSLKCVAWKTKSSCFTTIGTMVPQQTRLVSYLTSNFHLTSDIALVLHSTKILLPSSMVKSEFP